MSAAEQAIDNMAAAQAMELKPPSGTAKCPQGCVRMGVFFDGTGNNFWRDQDVDDHHPRNPASDAAPSNVAKLWQVYKQEGTILKKIYHHGVGTDSARQGHGSDKTSWDWTGSAGGAGGAARVDWGLNQLAYFFSNDNNHLAEKKLIDIYGFSRGAAIARDFVNAVRTRGIRNYKGPVSYRWVRVGKTTTRVKEYPRHTGVKPMFLGLFDTVASFALGGLEKGNELAGVNLHVDHTWVDRTVHMVAEDEIRGNFPLSSIFMDPNKKSSQKPLDFKDCMIEIWYPGAHSDVGGGYVLVPEVPARSERWVSGGFTSVHIPAQPYKPPVKPDLALIPLRDMNKASLKHHVPMDEISVRIPDDLEEAYKDYDSFRAHTMFSISPDPDEGRYIQTFPSERYRPLYYIARDAQPSIIFLKVHYIHDSRWGVDRGLDRKQRTVLYAGPQPT